MKSKSSLRAAILAGSIAALLAAPAAFAGNTWDGGGGSGLWNTNANWNLDTAPSTGVALTFAGNAQNSTSNDLVAVDPSFAGILFTNSGAVNNTNAFTLAGSRITLGGNITTTANTAGATITDIINLDMVLDANRTITTNQQSATVQHNLTISGIISEDVAGRTLTKAGGANSILTLSGANTYSGSTTVSNGLLYLNNLNAIQNSSSVSVASGAQLQLNVDNGTYGNTSAVTLVGAGVAGSPGNAGALSFGHGGLSTSTLNAPITLGGATTISSFGVTMNQTLGGAISGTGGLTIDSRGGAVGHFATWTLNAASTYSGNTTILNDDGLTDATVKLGIANALPTTTSLNLQGATNMAVAVFTTLDLNGFSQQLAGLTDTGSSQNNASNTVGKRVINSSGTLSTLTLDITSGINTYGTTGTRVLAGTIGGTTAAGAAANNLALNKTGAGTLTLGGANTYTGGTTISVGTLRVGNTTALGANASAVSVTSGAILDMNGITMTGTNALTLNGSGIGGTGALINSSISALGRYAGTVTLGSASTIGTTGTQVMQVSDGTNSVVNLNGFLLTLKGNGTIAAAINIPRGNGITGAGGVTVDGAYLDLRTGGAQSTNTYSGTTTVQNGGGILHNGSNFSANSNIILNGGVLDGYFNSAFTRALGTGATQVQITGGASGFGTNGSATINLGGAGAQVVWDSAFFSPTSLVLGTPGSSAGTTTFSNPIDLSGTTRTISANSTVNAGAISGIISNSTGTAGLTKTGVGTLNLTSATANTYNGGTTISQGTLTFDTRFSMPASGDVAVASGAALGVTVASTGTTWGSGTTVAGIAGLTSTANSGGTGFGGQAGSTVTFAGNSSLFLNVTGVTTESNDIGNGGATNLTLIKGGASNLTLSGNNSYSGGTTLSAGVLTVGSATAIPSTGTIALNAGTIQSNDATARSFSNAVTIGGDFTVGGTGNMTFSNTGASVLGGNRIITVTTGGVNATFAQAFSGANSITKAGAGTLTLSGNNIHSGGTTLTGGTLVAFGTGASTTALGTGALTWGTSGTTLEFRRDGDMSVGNVLTTSARSTTRTLVVSRVSSGPVNLAFTQIPNIDCGSVLNFQAGANVTGTPTITFSAGTTSSDSNNGDRTQSANSATGPITFNPTGVNLSIASIGSSGRTRAYFLSGTSTGNQITGAIANGTGTTIDKVGSGTWTLSGANAYTGTTTITAGTLIANSTSALGTGAASNTLIFNGTGTLQASGTITSPTTRTVTLTSTGLINTNGNAVSIAGVMSGAGGVTKSGAGILTLTGANTYAGITTVSAGSLTVSGAGTLANSTGLAVSNGATFNYLPTTIGTTLTLGAGSTLNLADGSVLGLAWDATTANKITALGAATVGTGTGVGLSMAGSYNSGTTYTVLTAGSGLDTGSYVILNPTDYTALVAKAATTVTVTPTTVAALANAFWTGGFSGFTNVWAVSDGSANSNWVTAAGGGATGLVPGSGADVSISATSVTTAPTASVLGANMSIRSLTIADTTNGLGLNADGFTLTIANAAGLTMNASVPSSTIAASVALGASQTWTNNSINNLTVSGAISGANNLTKAGTGTLVLTGANTYVNTTISAGTLQIGAGGSTGTLGSGTVLNNAALIINRNDQVLVSNVISGTGSVRTNAGSAGQLIDIAANNSYSGGTFIDVGILRLRTDFAGADLGTGTVTVANGASYEIWAPGAVTLTNNIVLNGATGVSGRPALNQDGGAGLVTLSGTVTLNATSDIGIGGGSSNNMTISGVVSGVGGMIVDERGQTGVNRTLTLSGANTYTGPTTLNGGILKAGVVSVANVSGAFGNNSAVTLANVATGPVLDITGFNTQIGSLTGGGALGGNVTLGAATLTVGGDNTSPAAYAGVISGTGGLIKIGTGTQIFSGANNYTGVTTVNAGVLRLNSANAIPGGIGAAGGTSALTFNGGVIGLGTGNFTRALGTGTTQVQFTGSGGFAAYTADRTVDLGGAAGTVTWNVGSFVPTGSSLILGATAADKTVTLVNPIDLVAANRTVQVENGSDDTDAVLSGNITATTAAGGLTKTGAGTLDLNGTTQGYDSLTATGGTTNVNGTLGFAPVGNAAVSVTGSGTKLRFGSVSQTLNSLTIGAGATVIFTSGTATGSFSGGGGKGPSFGGSAVVPEPGTIGLLLVGALGVLNRRRRQA